MALCCKGGQFARVGDCVDAKKGVSSYADGDGWGVYGAKGATVKARSAVKGDIKGRLATPSPGAVGEIVRAAQAVRVRCGVEADGLGIRAEQRRRARCFLRPPLLAWLLTVSCRTHLCTARPAATVLTQPRR